MYGFVIVILHRCLRKVFSREPRLYKRVCPSVGPSVMLLSAGRDEPANDLFCVYELVYVIVNEKLTHLIDEIDTIEINIEI